jgi:hypothetical protein
MDDDKGDVLPEGVVIFPVSFIRKSGTFRRVKQRCIDRRANIALEF